METVFKTQVDTANSLYRDGKFTEAQQVYLHLQELDPENTAVLEKLGSIYLWQNQVEEAERCFKKALSCLPSYQRFWPLNAQIKYRLAMTYYRNDNFAEAARLFDEAAGPIAVGPFRELKAFKQQLALFASQTPYIVEGPQQSQVDFIVTDPLPVVAVSVNGSQPLHFFIDTGGAEIILDKQLAQEVGVDFSGSFSSAYGGNTKAETGLGKIDSIQIGEFLVRNVPVHILDTEHMSSIFDGLEIKGIIGTRFLMHFLSTLDYTNGNLLLRRAVPETMQYLEQQITAGKAKAMPFWLIEMHYIVTWGTVNNLEPMLFFVDTGLAGKGFTAPEPILRDAGVAFDWRDVQQGPVGGGTAESVDIVLDRLTLGVDGHAVTVHGVPGAVIKNSVPILGDTLGFHIGGLISHQFFRNHSLTLDFANMRLLVH